MEELLLFGGVATFSIWVLLALAWNLAWKGWALWIAGGRKEKWWFIALLVLNTFAILEIIYIFAITKEGQKLFKSKTSSKEETVVEVVKEEDGKEI